MNRKKCVSIVFFLLLAIAFVPRMTNAQVSVGEHRWHEHVFTSQQNAAFSKAYSLDTDHLNVSDCIIWIRRNPAEGISISAIRRGYIDPVDHQKWDLIQQTTIVPTNDAPRRSTLYGEARTVSERTITVRSDTPDVFQHDYATAAKALPSKVKDLFYGAYGLGKRPTELSALNPPAHQ